ncbi:MAG: hypothetical protein Q9211_000597 [Gyalolechia sp. 1 TL-2023]
MAAANPTLPVPVFLSFQGASHQAKQYSRDIFTAQRALVHMLDRYEETLIKRWLKKTTSQRQKILLMAFPSIPPTHRPDFYAFRQGSRGLDPRYRDYWLLPSLNLEDLSKPKNLLFFIRSRSRNPPGVFVNADANSVHVGHVAQALMPPYLSGYTMLLAGQNTQYTYGRMISWDEDAEAFDMMSSGIGLQPGEGLQVMEIQQRKMDFLQKCTELVLQDLPLRDLGIPKQPAPADDCLAIRASEWPSLTQEIEEAPYRLQDALDMTRLRAFVLARRNGAEDHIWSLREDPSYFQDTVSEWSEHRQEKILTANGKSHPVLLQDVFWERVISNVVLNAYTDFVAWDIVAKEVDRLVDMRAQQPDQPITNQGTSGDCVKALVNFEYMVEQFTKGPISNWRVGMVASPPLRQHYVREPQDPHTTRIRVTTKNAGRKKGDHLLWLLEVFLQDDQLFLCGLENVCDELEREIRSSQASRERISPYVASLVSDLSLFGELKRQIGLMTPGPKMMELVDEDEKQAEFSKKTELLGQVYKAMASTGKTSAAAALPLKQFSYPSNKRRTQATTQTMQRAENNLDNFWIEVDDRCKRPLARTFIRCLTSELDSTSSALAALELQNRTEGTVTTASSRTQEKQKTKTRGVPQTSPPTNMQEIDRTRRTEDEALRVFEVSKRGFKVFATLFYTPTEDEPPGEIPWSEFLSAMASVGFSINKLDGSAWIFAPVDDQLQQSIIFHEPHPGSKVPFQVARRFGRRLWRTYGWTSENFRRA